MSQESLDYRRPSTPPEDRSVRTIVVVVIAASVFIASLACCIATWDSPRRLLFLPAGDVAMGFRSTHGWVDWIEYTDWDKREYPSWSIPWLAFFALELLPVWLVLRRPRRPAA
jgi:hypothetical protein